MNGIQYGPERWYGASPPCIREPWMRERRGAMEKSGEEEEKVMVMMIVVVVMVGKEGMMMVDHVDGRSVQRKGARANQPGDV